MLEVTGVKPVFKIAIFFILAQALASAIASTKVMKAQQVVKSESGEEVKVLFIFSEYSLLFMVSRLLVFLTNSCQIYKNLVFLG